MTTSHSKSIFIVLGVCMFVVFVTPMAKAADYFPIKVGNSWVYYPSYGDGNRVDSVVGTKFIDGNLTYIWKRVEAAPDNYVEKRWLVKGLSSIKVLKYWSNEMSPPKSILLEPPWLQDKLNPMVGTKWKYEVDIGSSHYKVTCWVESINATVKVPAGTFNQCIIVRQLDEMTRNGSTEYTYRKHWLAPDVGPVMYNKYGQGWKGVRKSQKLIEWTTK
jgi:hypothetical protein